jgi:type I restriction enzyme M protein
MQFEEFQPEIDWWGDESDGFKARKETDQAWKRSVEYLEVRGYNFDDKNPFEALQKDLNPDDLLQEYKDAQDDIQKLRNQLKSILADALNGDRP